MPQSAREEVEITALIRGILNGYPGNSAILREYLQNSDDAKALKQIFILDERTHPSETILDPSLKDAQGPALIAYNDGVLRLQDWKALRTIHSSSKTTDEEQTGKNGLGFRASYHLTENPHVLSSETLMVLDPHRVFAEHPGGISINVIEEGATYKDQLSPFKSIIPGEIVPFSGTAFRLPFRTRQQASRSRISDKATHIEEFREILQGFVSNELESVILFLKHITSIEVRRIDPLGKTSILGKIEIDRLDMTQNSGQAHRNITLSMEGRTAITRKWFFYHHHVEKNQATSLMSSRLKYDIEDRLTQEKLTPGVDISFPLEGPNVRGGLFTLLPLPVNIHGSSFHLNATFALTPDRQNLKKKQEVGDRRSRERLLVEWNTIIMEEWAPVAWAKALSDLDPENLRSRGWLAWPPEERDQDSYWLNLAHQVTKKIVDCRASLFPTYDLQRLVSVQDNSTLFSAVDNRPLFSILSRFDVHIVQPPPHIFRALETIVYNFQASTLSPRSLHKLLRDSLSNIPDLALDVAAAHKVMDYLALTSPPTLRFLSDLPLFSLNDGSRVSLTSPSANTRWIIPATEEEALLFADDPHMLDWGCVSDNLRVHFLKAQAARVLNVTTLNVELVSAFLISRFSPLDSSSDELPKDHVTNHVDWLFRFWTWVSQWPAREDFFKTQTESVQHLHLLPTSDASLRKISSKVVIFRNVSQAAVRAWNVLGVHGLHTSIPRDAVSIFKEKRIALEQGTPGFVSLLIRSCITDRQPLLDQDSFFHIRDSLTSGLRLGAEPEFSLHDRQKLLAMPVFMVRHHPGGRPSTIGPASGSGIFIKLPDNYPLPRLENDHTVYIDMGDSTTASLINLVNRNGARILSELDILNLAIDHWDSQSIDLQDHFIDRIFDNRHHIANLRKRLTTLNFVSVNQVDHRVPPCGLIHPHSPLETLYQGEAGKLPTGRFSSSDYLLVMQSEGFVDASLNDSIVEERIKYFSSVHSEGELIFRKATTFVQLLNQAWKPSYRRLILQGRSMTWFPSNDFSLIAPDRCRDSHRDPHTHPYYYDLCWTALNRVMVSTPGFRSALGWSDQIPFYILVEQLRRTLKLAPDQKSYRLIELLNYLGQRHAEGALTTEIIDDLKEVVDGQSWIPVMARYLVSHSLVTSRYAVLSESSLKPPFRQVDPHLKYREFFIEMGCTKRPAFEILVEELKQCKMIDSAIQILAEISLHHPDFDRTLVVVPDISGNLCPIDSVYYPDMNLIDLTGEMSQNSPLHNNISRSLSDCLGIPLASSLTLGDDEDDDEQMSEDLGDRIRGFLREYDAQYAINEFLANADDAGATEFKILFDSGNFRDLRKKTLISPAFESIQGSPSLVLYNNATLSKTDFTGLRRVGRGGKSELSETHGRHGLGALSFYYFTDVVTVISRDTVMILDPSAQYLPPGQHGRKRTALTRKISDIVRVYPDQFKSYPKLQFSPFSPDFNGTIFILPLASSITERPLDDGKTRGLIEGSYRDLSQNAFFFTKLEKISASHLSAGNNFNYLWRLSATRIPIPFPYSYLSQCILDVDGVSEEWLIATSNETPIPTCHDATADGLKLRRPSAMKVQLAIKVTPQLKHMEPHLYFGSPLPPPKYVEPQSYLFSTLRLPKATSLPFHLHSRFAISSNRQSIVFAPADSRDNRDSKTLFNVWILEEIVPYLYISALEHLLHSSSDSSSRFDNERWWLSGPSDEISSVVKVAFRKLLPEANSPLFKSAANEWISFRDTVFSKDEPENIRLILRKLKASKFVSSCRRSGITEISAAKIVDTNFVKQVLLLNSAVLQRWFEHDKIKATTICEILSYVAKEAPLVGLPGLVYSTDCTLRFIPIPKADVLTIYISSHSSHSTLFPSSLFLARLYSGEVLEYLQKDPSISVVALSEKNITALITAEIGRFRSDGERNSWLDSLWVNYPTLPAPPDLKFLDNPSMKIVKTSSQNLSLPQCLPNEVIYDKAAVEENGLASISQKLGITVLNVDSNSVIGKYLLKRFPNKVIVNFLLCLQAKPISSFTALTQAEHQHLSEWLRQNIYRNISDWRLRDPGIGKSFLLELPIWTVYRDQRQQQLSASGISVLPRNFPIEKLISYLKPATSIAKFSSEFVGFLEYCKNWTHGNFTCMSASDIMNVVSLPAKLKTPVDFQRLTPFLHSILQLPIKDLQYANIQLPASDGTLRSVNELYDHTVNLFATTLKYAQRPCFLHEHFRDISLDTIRFLGMKHVVDLPSFTLCASEVQRLSGQHQPGDHWPNRQELLKMSDTSFKAYQGVLPSLLMTKKHLWASLDGISFIRPKDVRRQGVSYDWRAYFDDSPPTLLAPPQFVRTNLEPIVWTQRYLCLYEPTAELLAVNTSFGVPHASEVVEHLKVLTTRIAQDHPKNPVLLSDIQATYKWLDEHSEEAGAFLLSASHLKLFLNVNEPITDEWTGQWETAGSIMLNLHYDHGKFKRAKDFLLKYDKLLLAAGSTTIKFSNRDGREPAPNSSESDLQRLRKVLNVMRKSGELTDIMLVPTSRPSEGYLQENYEMYRADGLDDIQFECQDGADNGVKPVENMVDNSLALQAHRLILAAVIPYFRDRVKVENIVDEIPFYGSWFGAKLVLDYVYTGDFDLSFISTDAITVDEEDHLLQEFLQLMSIADEWSMPKLKEKLEWAIIHKFNMIQRLPHSNQIMREEAEKYNAVNLKDALDEFEKHNGSVIRNMQERI